VVTAALFLVAQSWPAYHGGPENIKYSTSRQITPANVNQLKIAWQWDSGDAFEGSEMQCNPIVVDGVMYASTPRLRIAAIDAATGALRWSFDPNRPGAKPSKRRNRGVMYWRGQILFGFESWLIRLDAKTGKEIGRIDLREGLGRDPKHLSVINTTPGVILPGKAADGRDDLLIIGHLTGEDLPSSPGDIRAYRLSTGTIAWTFHTIPRDGEPGAETWPADAWKTLGGANNWSGMALDLKRAIVYVPTGSAAFDFYAANRLGDNLYANCLLALDARTGKRLWHFQFVRHDVWDRDLPTAPSLVTVRRNGKLVDAVAQITKSGHVFVFNRVTGESLFPLEERDVPPSDIDGEVLAKRQILPLKPAPFSRQMLTREMVPEAMRDAFDKIRSGDQFTPPSREGTVIFPGFDGGGEWGGAAFDPETRLLYVNANEMPWVLRLVPRPPNRAVATAEEVYQANCAGCHRADKKGTPPEFPSLTSLQRPADQVEEVIRKGSGRMPAYGQFGEPAVAALAGLLLRGENPMVRAQITGVGLKYSTDGYNKFLDPQGYPAVAPPWGTLSAIDLDTGEYRWKIPFGEFPELAAQGRPVTGTENYGGGIVTKTGLFFIAATNHDRKIRAFDKLTGKPLWEHALPAAGNATPAMYEVKGRQYLVIGAGGGKSKGPTGGSYVAFALP
jgi:quinoprotein glucose dehydrogenase